MKQYQFKPGTFKIGDAIEFVGVFNIRGQDWEGFAITPRPAEVTCVLTEKTGEEVYIVSVYCQISDSIPPGGQVRIHPVQIVKHTNAEHASGSKDGS